ncbi:MAG: hypothetical protein JRM78_03220 [Nitrososphaerota archaeon]|nr:hypothetical protein [Nitrososphaerota archaeon]MDG7047738.1 hypothetical protein [Nitrososphaerota archaeon]
MIYTFWLILVAAGVLLTIYPLAGQDNTKRWLYELSLVNGFWINIVVAVTSVDIEFVSAGTIISYHGLAPFTYVFFGLALLDIALFFIGIIQLLRTR